MGGCLGVPFWGVPKTPVFRAGLHQDVRTVNPLKANTKLSVSRACLGVEQDVLPEWVHIRKLPFLALAASNVVCSYAPSTWGLARNSTVIILVPTCGLRSHLRGSMGIVRDFIRRGRSRGVLGCVRKTPLPSGRTSFVRCALSP